MGELVLILLVLFGLFKVLRKRKRAGQQAQGPQDWEPETEEEEGGGGGWPLPMDPWRDLR